jgi:hypothetical protein
MTEPEPPNPDWPRYSTRPFPSYRFIPGKTPHSRRSVNGHSYDQPEPKPRSFPAAQWQTSEDYLYGIDLYNFAYWWEAHEVFEGLWHAVGHNTEQGNFFQALIQLAAANLKHFLGNDTAAQNLTRSGMIRLRNIPPSYMGIDVACLTATLHAHSMSPDPQTPLIGLG